MVTQIYLFRHAITEWNEQQRVQGWTDTGLSARGRKEVRKIRNLLKERPLQAIYSSPLRRAFQTAQEIARQKKLSIIPVEEFKEAKFGIFEGMRYEEIDQHKIFQEGLRRKGHFNFHPPKGESYKDLYERVSQKLDEIVLKHRGESIAIVAHGGVIRCIALHIGIITPERMRDLHIPHGQCFHFQYHHLGKRYSPIDFPININN